MKTKIIRNCFMLLAAGIAWQACDEEPVGQQPVDGAAPGAVSNLTVENIAGGALLTYTLPDDEDLLYVKAVYTRNGEVCESRTSLYSDTLKVEGYGDTLQHEVQVIAVDRSRNESTPVQATIQPLEPEVITIGSAINLIADFGGVMAQWTNARRAEISVVIMEENDLLMEYVPIETFYSSVVNGRGSVHGMDTIPRNFGAYVQDHWGNRSAVKYFELKPLFEIQFDRLKFTDASLPGDAPHYGGGWALSNIWDGIKGQDQGYSSQANSGTPLPHSITINLGTRGQISRIRLYQRAGDYVFSEGNPRSFEVWGCETLDPSGSWDSWTKLIDCESIKPSGLPMGENTNEDIAVARDGEDFINYMSDLKVHYIRIKVLRTWAGGDNFQVGEIEIFGDDRQDAEN
jgi:hypothetical protein